MRVFSRLRSGPAVWRMLLRTEPQCTGKISTASRRMYATHKDGQAAPKQSLSRYPTKQQTTAVGTARKVVETSKDVAYTGVILAGLAFVGIIMYTVTSELFSSDSRNSIYQDALKKCKDSTELMETLGSGVKAFGEETRRGRRRHVRHQEFWVGERQFMRLHFYVQGERDRGTVHVDMEKNDKGKYEYRLLWVEVPGQGLPSKQIVILDNR
eukprot:Clim_evm154s157 gene=Clim_evmTU154s157